jgi:serine/threonine-protein kinase HipA
VGALAIDRHGDLSFAYGPEWLSDPEAPAISISLPKRLEPFNRREARPFFAGLLPEEAQREAAARSLGVSAGNDFRLLEKLGGDVAGALTLWPEGEAPPRPEGLGAVEPLSDDRLVEILDTLPRRPLLAGEAGLRLSLAGAQPKLPVVLVNGRVALPAPGQPTSHILKPPIAGLPTTTENEAFAMRLAAAVGLGVAPVEPRRTEDRAYLLVTRYDRSVDAAGAMRRLHQEDFCQALGVTPEHKYAAEGGPVFSEGFSLVRRACVQPAVAVLALLDAAIFNLLIGNADAHGKNYGLLYGPQGAELAPLYDLLSTVAYPQVHGKLAMKIGKRATLEEFRGDTWDVFAGEIQMAAPFVRRRAAALSEAVLAQAEGVAGSIVAGGFGHDVLDPLVKLVQGRARQVLALSSPSARSTTRSR